MNKKTIFSGTLRRALAITIILALAISALTSCSLFLGNNSFLDDDAVVYRLDENKQIPEFDTELFSTVEIYFNYYYYTDLESNETLADKTVNTYLEFCADTDTSDKEAVTIALINCYITAVGDIYSFYRTADELKDYTTNMSGNFVGIGVSVLRDDIQNTIHVQSVEPNSPAQKAGILPGDYIVGVDGLRVEDIGTYETVNKIRGEEGTSVNVTVLRDGEEISYDMIRAKITETTVSYEIYEDTKTGYIKVTSFKDNTAEQFIAAVDAIEAAKVTGVIFDLRDNPGGYLDTAEAMLSYLVPTGTPIASFSNGKNTLYASEGTELEPTDHKLDIPSVVICNASSASAAELFSGAMRDYNDMGLLECALVGDVTFKKGIMQSTFMFEDGSALTLTTALYNPPSGINFHGVGVTPDRLIAEGEDYIDIAHEELEKLKLNTPPKSDI